MGNPRPFSHIPVSSISRCGSLFSMERRRAEVDISNVTGYWNCAFLIDYFFYLTWILEDRTAIIEPFGRTTAFYLLHIFLPACHYPSLDNISRTEAISKLWDTLGCNDSLRCWINFVWNEGFGRVCCWIMCCTLCLVSEDWPFHTDIWQIYPWCVVSVSFTPLPPLIIPFCWQSKRRPNDSSMLTMTFSH